MWEIAKLQMSVEKVDSDDGRLEYLWQLARVEADAVEDSNLESRSKKLAEEEDLRQRRRAVLETGLYLAVKPSRVVPPNA
jgi:hypothetical protein